MKTIYFLHGLNTFADHQVHIGPIRLGKMHAFLEKQFAKEEIKLIAILYPLLPSLEMMADHVAQHLLKHSNEPIHILGHSMGALLGRILTHREDLKTRIISLTSIATPHHGTPAALKYQSFDRVLISINKTWRQRISLYRQLTPQAMNKFNTNYPEIRGITHTSLSCFETFNELSWPSRVLNVASGQRKDMLANHQYSDGLIPLSSQTFAESLGQFQLDHLCQLGYFFYFNSHLRQKKESEFKRMVATIARSRSQYP